MILGPSGDTARRWAVVIPTNTPDEEISDRNKF